MSTTTLARHLAALLLTASACAAYDVDDDLLAPSTPIQVVAPAPVLSQIPALVKQHAHADLAFQSINYPDQYIRATNDFMGHISPDIVDTDGGESSFRIVPGLSGAPGTISFESVRYPGHYLRHQGFALKLHPRVATELYRHDASFLPQPGLGADDGVSFQSLNYPGHYIRHRGFELHIDPIEKSDLYRADATFRVLPHPSTPALAVARRD